MSTTKTNYKKQTFYGKNSSISVVVPSFNNEKTIRKCIESLASQNYPRNLYDIIVVDNFSKDKTEKICKEFKQVRFVKKVSSPAQARNHGARIAKGKIILFTDSDCVLPKNLLQKVIDNFRKYDIAGVGGSYKTLNKENYVARYTGYEIGWRHDKQSKETDFLGTYCCAYRRDIFLKYGGFDETFKIASGEDPELSFKIFNAGHKLMFDNSMFVWHVHPSALKIYLRQQFWRAYWRVNLYKKHPDKMGGDIYTGLEIPYSPMIMGTCILCLIFSAFSHIMLYAALLSLIAFFLTYLSFFKFVSKIERRLVLATIGIVFLRTIIWLFGFVYGLKTLLYNKLKKS